MKRVLFLLLSVFSLTIFAQQKKVAVYVTGDDPINSIMGDHLVDGIAHDGKYIAVERTASFLNELVKEQSYQQTGTVDDDEISRLGKQFGVDYVCVATPFNVWGEKYISVRMIDVERAEVIATSSANGKVENSTQFLAILNTLTSILLKSFEQSKIADAKKVAVYVTRTGNKDIDIILGDQLVAGFAASGRYLAIERTQGFLNQLSKEQSYQQTGAVDDVELSRLGKQFGVHYVCVANVDSLFGDYFISTRLINVETAEIANSHNEEGAKLSNSADVISVTQKIASILSDMTILEQQQKESEIQQQKEEAQRMREAMLLEQELETKKIKELEIQKCLDKNRGIHNGYEYMDLGLSVMWATCNMGAKFSYDAGDYYAVGETAPKLYFYEENYTYSKKAKKIHICPLEYDAASVNMGGTWRLPTQKEMAELVEQCYWIWTTENGQFGYRVQGETGAYIFLPAIGPIEWDHGGAPGRGTYLSSNIGAMYCTTLCIDGDSYSYMCGTPAHWGALIRPVCESIK